MEEIYIGSWNPKSTIKLAEQKKKNSPYLTESQENCYADNLNDAYQNPCFYYLKVFFLSVSCSVGYLTACSRQAGKFVSSTEWWENHATLPTTQLLTTDWTDKPAADLGKNFPLL